MRATLIFFVVLLLAFAGYAYYRDPAGVEKMLNDAGSIATSGFKKLRNDAGPVATSLSPMAPHPDAASPTPAAPAPPAQPAATAPSSASTSPAANPPPPPFKAWSPPAVMPAQPNWTWTTLDGKTYQNVVVTKIEPETVSITHSMGAAHNIPINLLPPDIQKQLNYDPIAAAAARAESARELAHPYYNFASLVEAQAAARQTHLPLAWVVSGPALLSAANPEADSWADLTQMAMEHLKTHSIVIFVDGYTELMALPSIIRDQLFHLDDGVLPDGHHFNPPKIVFSDANVTKTLGRVPYTQMKASGALAIDEVLASIPKDSGAQPPSNGSTANAPAPPVSSPTAAPVPATPPSPTSPATAATAPASAPAATPSPDANKPWAPPDVMPSQPNWTWATSDGKTYQNVVVTKIEPETVSITHSMGAAHIPIILLPPDIQKQLNYNPHAASQLSALIDGKLVSADGTAASAPGPSVRYYAIYYSAQWCPPCHAFTPRLVKWYNAFKPAHPNFELIFVSEDHNAAAMLDYMKEMTMPWPAVRFGDLQHDGRGTFRGSGIEKFAGAGIPDLVLVDTGGKVLSDSYQNGTYVGPETVVEDINKFIGSASPVPLAHQTPSAPVSRLVFISARD